MIKVRTWLKEQLKNQDLLIALSLIDNLLTLLKEIAWRILSLFICYPAFKELIEDTAFSDMAANTDLLILFTLAAIIVMSFKFFLTLSGMEFKKSLMILILSCLSFIFLEYSKEKFFESLLLYLCIATMEWICSKAALIIEKRDVPNSGTLSIRRGIENENKHHRK